MKAIIKSSVVCLLCSNIYAEDGLKAKAELGLVYVTGNSETSSLNLHLSAKKTKGLSIYNSYVKYLRAEDSDTLTAQRVEFGLGYDHKKNDHMYWGARTRYEADDFSSYSYQATITGVAGYIFSDTEVVKLKAEVGAGYRFAELEMDATKEDETILTAAVDHHWQISKTASLDNKMLIESGSANTFSLLAMGLTSQINGSLALKFAVELRHNSEVEDGSENLDTQTTANIVYTFK